ncbi:MAG TPA: hypothetical protein VMA75_04705 [Candidatus Paceibacterota bacterium]|nr:hypothetical protein [Candidatus Paceibacterota bacterium]
MENHHVGRKIGRGEFGDIYTGIKGQEAVDFLLKKKSGEIQSALSHPEIGDNIDLVYGKYDLQSDEGYGLAKLEQKHPESLRHLEKTFMCSKVVSRSRNRVRLLNEGDGNITIIRLDWDGKDKKWLLTQYIPTKE